MKWGSVEIKKINIILPVKDIFLNDLSLEKLFISDQTDELTASWNGAKIKWILDILKQVQSPQFQQNSSCDCFL